MAASIAETGALAGHCSYRCFCESAAKIDDACSNGTAIGGCDDEVGGDGGHRDDDDHCLATIADFHYSSGA